MDLERFINYVNGFHHALKFTWEISETCVSFLDISVSINGDAFATSVSYKPTDSHSYLLFSSSHPNHTKQYIPYSQFLRLRRLCRDDKDFETKSLEMRTFFVERGYPTHLLDSAIQKAFNNSRRDTLKPPLAKISDDKIPLVLTFHPFNYKVRDVISRNFLILKNDPETSAIFTDNPLISFRHNKNMRDNLVRSALRQIYRHQWVPFLALVLVVTRVRSSILRHLFPDLNPISLFGTILHLLQHHLLHFLQ